MIKTTCDTCGVEIERHPFRIERNKHHFCSHECRVQFQRDNSPVVECCVCKKAFNRCPTGIKEYNYCSKECQRKGYIGERVYNYTGNRTLYKSMRDCECSKQWRLSCIKRDNLTCQECGKSDDIVVHHIKHFIDIINDNELNTVEEAINCKELWDTDNGITLCVDCHKEKHRGNKDE